MIYFSYRACLALQITNLLTRAMFAIQLDMNDLPAVSLIHSFPLLIILNYEMFYILVC